MFIKKGHRKSFWITKELETEIRKRIDKKEQALIYINRRGYSFFVQCKNCGFTFLCPNCSVSLTLHQLQTNSSPKKSLNCHYCNHTQNYPKICPECKDTEKNFVKRGIGTQQIVNILREIFPDTIIERADLDTTKKKKSWHETVEKFESGKIDILVGTQTITKGYHFPKVTLVGIIWADLNLNFPVFNGSETTIQKLIQVAGRAGRQSKDSLVIAQILQNNNIFNYLNEKDYLDFCNEEIEFRKETNYPPFSRFLQIELKNKSIINIDKDSQKLFNILQEESNKQKVNITLLGPTKPVVYRIQKEEIRQIFIKSPNFKEIYKILKNIELDKFDSNIFVVPTQ